MPSLHCPHECCILLQCRFASLDNPHATVSCRELLLHPAVHKCHATCFHAVGQAIAPSLQWVSQFIANTSAVRFLCLHLMPGATWTSNWSRVGQWPKKLSRYSGHILLCLRLSINVNSIAERRPLRLQYSSVWRSGFPAPRRGHREQLSWAEYLSMIPVSFFFFDALKSMHMHASEASHVKLTNPTHLPSKPDQQRLITRGSQIQLS
jgi:hypothetical protein